jgi:hypothetical protein
MEKKVKPEHEAVEALNREFAIKNARDAARYGPPKYGPLLTEEGETRVLAGSLPAAPKVDPDLEAAKADPEFVEMAKAAGLSVEDAVKLTKLFRGE